MMKKLIMILVFMGVMVNLSMADDPKQEAMDSLSTAQSMIKQGNINKAVEEINYALSKLNEVSATKMLTFIPEAPEGFTLESKNSQGMGQGASMVGNAGAEGHYIGQDDSRVKLSIATGGVTGKLGSLASFGSMFAGMSQDGGVKSVRIQGFTGTLQYDTNSKSGNLTIQVGEKTSVQVEGDNVASDKILKSFAEKMDLSKLSTSF
ncbi:MAG: hypothetical protein KKD44_04550 [Proteobacteria bacterium]|nr:hypothetical protein [Pseudomonadota bacterium]